MPEHTPDARVQRLERLLFQEDPMRLDFGTNPDEYRPEAETIAARMPQATSLEDTLTVVYEEFSHWFSPGAVGPKRAYRRIAERTWDLWRER